MSYLKLVSQAGEYVSLNEQETQGDGFQAHGGVTGLGLPPVATQFLEGAGDGSVFRGQRLLSPDIDIPLSLLGRDGHHLRSMMSLLTRVVNRPCVLHFYADDESVWSRPVHRAGGGDYLYGVDTSETEAYMVITFRSPDPYWTSEMATQTTVKRSASIRGLLPNLTALQLSASQALGIITLNNEGDMAAYPTWVIYGPGSDFVATSTSGEVLHWTGSLGVGDVLTIDTAKGTCVDNAGVNRYAEFGSAPRMWSIPPGNTSATAALSEPDENSRIVCSWRTRRLAVI